jgi:hypothetical protein
MKITTNGAEPTYTLELTREELEFFYAGTSEAYSHFYEEHRDFFNRTKSQLKSVLDGHSDKLLYWVHSSSSLDNPVRPDGYHTRKAQK